MCIMFDVKLFIYINRTSKKCFSLFLYICLMLYLNNWEHLLCDDLQVGVFMFYVLVAKDRRKFYIEGFSYRVYIYL